MEIIRRLKDKPICHQPQQGMQQRGFRDNKSPMVAGKKGLYISPHCTGKGVDFNVKDETAEQTRLWLVSVVHVLPYKIRLERRVQGKLTTWVHLDLYTHNQEEPIKFFEV